VNPGVSEPIFASPFILTPPPAFQPPLPSTTFPAGTQTPPKSITSQFRCSLSSRPFRPPHCVFHAIRPCSRSNATTWRLYFSLQTILSPSKLNTISCLTPTSFLPPKPDFPNFSPGSMPLRHRPPGGKVLFLYEVIFCWFPIFPLSNSSPLPSPRLFSLYLADPVSRLKDAV